VQAQVRRKHGMQAECKQETFKSTSDSVTAFLRMQRDERARLRQERKLGRTIAAMDVEDFNDYLSTFHDKVQAMKLARFEGIEF